MPFKLKRPKPKPVMKRPKPKCARCGATRETLMDMSIGKHPKPRALCEACAARVASIRRAARAVTDAYLRISPHAVRQAKT